MIRRAFTLIELLVVIAIIAILAAILFPVFAQAKQAAKKAADLSNTKQINTAFQIYLSDTDDTYPVFFTRIAGGVCLPNAPSMCGYRSMWQFHIQPYMKNFDLLHAPDEPKQTDPALAAFNISYGYNYGYLSTLCPAGFTGNGCPGSDPGAPGLSYFIGINASQIDRPANIVALADNGGHTVSAASIVGSMVNPPDAWPSQKYFYGPVQVGWGLNCQTYFAAGQGASGKWGDTDGFAARYADGGNVAFADGHSKFNKVGAAAAGTNYNKNQSCTLTAVTEYANYIWDPRFSTGPQQ